MPSFNYVARDAATGREVRNSVEASTESNAIAALLNRNMLVVSIKEKAGKKTRAAGGSVPLQDLVIFTRQLATMIDAGLAMVQCLQALAEQTTNKVMRDTIKDVCARVEAGESFSEALIRHPKAFNRLYVSMVGAGEKGGGFGLIPSIPPQRFPGYFAITAAGATARAHPDRDSRQAKTPSTPRKSKLNTQSVWMIAMNVPEWLFAISSGYASSSNRRLRRISCPPWGCWSRRRWVLGLISTDANR